MSSALVCDICGGKLSMDAKGEYAVCDSCGTRHSKERMKLKVQEITGTVKIDDTDAIIQQISNWERIASDSFNNANYSESYTYYCKVLEKKVDHWIATYRKGLCLGWQANLNNMHTNEVLGGILDATKLLYADNTVTDSQKANGSFTMAWELYNWINAINSLIVSHGNQYANKLVNAAQQFYQREQIVCTLISYDLSILTKFVYINYENKIKFDSLSVAICDLGRTIISNMSTSFKIKTGSKWNAFWETYDDVFQTVKPDYKTTEASKKLSSDITNFQNDFVTMKIAYNNEVRDKYWSEHSEEKAELEAEKNNLMNQIVTIQYEINQIMNNEEKEKIQNRIGELTAEKKAIRLFKLKEKKAIQDKIEIAVIELGRVVDKIKEDRKRKEAQIATLQQRIDEINSELTKDR